MEGLWQSSLSNLKRLLQQQRPKPKADKRDNKDGGGEGLLVLRHLALFSLCLDWCFGRCSQHETASFTGPTATQDYQRGHGYGGRDTTPAPLLKRWSSSERPPTANQMLRMAVMARQSWSQGLARTTRSRGRRVSCRFSTVLDKGRMRYCKPTSRTNDVSLLQECRQVRPRQLYIFNPGPYRQRNRFFNSRNGPERREECPQTTRVITRLKGQLARYSPDKRRHRRRHVVCGQQVAWHRREK